MEICIVIGDIMKRKWIGKNITILGLSKSGIAAAKYLAEKGANCTISEKRETNDADKQVIEELANIGIEVEMGGHNPDTILNSYLVITSPGIPPRSEVFKLIKDNKIQVISEIELAYLETTRPFIAITGTNGKTTTTKLVSELLEYAGYKAPACGNIGTPPTSLLNEEVDYFVTEVSSYQIATSNVFKPQIACFINYTPDHIDWHGSEEEYFKAKASLFSGSKAPAWAVLNADDPKIRNLASESNAEIYYFGKNIGKKAVYIENDAIMFKNGDEVEEIIKLDEINLFGDHNYQNIMAAVAIVKIVGIETQQIRDVLKTFKSPEHRIEYVDTIDGIKFYNDSKATNCDSTICALKAFGEEKIVLIAGGRDKGTSLDEFSEEVKKHAAAVVLIGEAAERFNDALVNAGYTSIYRAETFESAIDIAADLKLGPVVLSPACASFDMFKNFEERGQAFKDYVYKKKQNR